MMKKRVCLRCGNEVEKSELADYSYQCFECDEDLFEFETEVIEVKNSKLAKVKNIVVRKMEEMKMKKLVKGLVLVGTLAVGMVMGAHINQPVERKIIANQIAYDGEMQITYSDNTSETIQVELPTIPVEVSTIYEQVGTEQKLDGYYLEDGDIVVEFTDGSWAISNEKTNFHIFQPVDLGDWDYSLDNAQQLENIIKTYLSMKNTGMF